MGIKNKRGGEEFLSIWNFIIWLIVGVTLAIGLIVFFSADADLRGPESQILINRLDVCILDNFNEIVDKDFNKESNYFFEKCGLSEYAFNKGGKGSESNFYFNIEIKNNGSQEILFDGSGGNSDFLNLCKLSSVTDAKHFPVCFEFNREFIWLDDLDDNINVSIKIIAGSNQRGLLEQKQGTI